MNEAVNTKSDNNFFNELNEHPLPFISIGFDFSLKYVNSAAYELFSGCSCSLISMIKEWEKNIDGIITLTENRTEFESIVNDRTFLWKLYSSTQDQCINIYGLDISLQKNLELKLSERTFILNRKIKELDCLYEIAKIIEKPFMDLESIFKDVVLNIQKALRFRDNNSIRVRVDDVIYETDGFNESKNFISRVIEVRKEPKGSIEVFLNENIVFEKEPFLRGEKKLITTVARRIGKIVERITAERELAKLNEELKLLAFYDSLTGVMNRKYFTEQLKAGIAAYDRTKRKIAVFFIDIDDFKRINDYLGHERGDDILVTIASTIKSCIRKSDFIGRLGGDEFVICLNGIKSSDDALRIASKINNRLSAIEVFKKEHVSLQVSIGIAIFPDDAGSAQELFKFSDEAMYAAKRNGKGQALLFSKLKP